MQAGMTVATQKPLDDTIEAMQAIVASMDAYIDRFPIAEPELRQFKLQLLGMIQHQLYPWQEWLMREKAGSNA